MKLWVKISNKTHVFGKLMMLKIENIPENEQNLLLYLLEVGTIKPSACRLESAYKSLEGCVAPILPFQRKCFLSS